MATEIDRLVVVFDANFKAMDDKLNKVIRSNYAAAKKVEAAWEKSGGAAHDLGTALGTAASEIPGVGTALGALAGPAGIATAALAGLAVAFAGTLKAMQWADDLAATADRIGITAEELQGLAFAAESVDVSAEDLGSSLEGLNKSIGALRSGVGDKKFIEAFAALQIKPADMKGIKTAADLLPLLADRMREVGSVAEQVQIAKKLGVEALLPLLREGADGIKALTDKARELGLVLDEQMVANLAQANEEMRIATEVIKANLIPLFAGMATGIAKVSEKLVALIGWFRKFKEEHPEAFEVARNAVERATFGAAGAALLQAQRAAAAGRRGPAKSHSPGPATVLEDDWTPPVADPVKTKARAIKAAQQFAEVVAVSLDEAWRVIDADTEIQNRWLRNITATAEKFEAKGIELTADVMAGIGEGLRDTELELEATVYDGIRGGLEAGFREGLPGVLHYLQDALTRSILDSVAEGLTAAVLRKEAGGGILTSLASALFGRSYAAGTMSAKAGLALVGERGPELVRMPGGSQVIPNSQLRNVGVSGGGGGATTIVFDNRGAVIWEQAARQMMSYADRAAASSGSVAVQVSRRATPDDLARRGGRRLGR
jgi:hypothetical protein